MASSSDSPSRPEAAQLRLQLRGITKRYPSVLANDRVDLAVRPGEIHAVLGENGAGKSTLMKIIYGAVKPDEGQMWFDGRPVEIRKPQQARALGISMVFQHFSLFEVLTVAENVWLGLQAPLALPEVKRRIAQTAAAYGLEVDPERPVHTLSVGEMQRVEIIRALLSQPRLLILDEPTSVLTPQAVQKLFGVLRTLAEQGCSILYISHKLHEIRALCTACTVLRGGRVAGVCDPRQQSNASLARLMMGAEPPRLAPRPPSAGEVVLRVRRLNLQRADPFGVDLHDVALQVRAGEVVGIAGVSGNGQGELLRALSGEDARAATGTVLLTVSPHAPAHVPVHARGRTHDLAGLGPEERRRLGLHFVPEERLGRAAVPPVDLAHNLLLTRRESVRRTLGWIGLKALREQAAAILARYHVKAAGPEAAAQSLSGGNLQKFIMGREIEARPLLLILSQPTWGVDVGAAAQIRQAIWALRDAGCAVLVVSEELEELFELCDRLHVLARGRLSPSLAREQATVERVGAWMSGLWDEEDGGGEAPAPAALEVGHVAA